MDKLRFPYINRFVEAEEYNKLVENELVENVLQTISKPVKNVDYRYEFTLYCTVSTLQILFLLYKFIYSMGKSIVQNINADQDAIRNMHSFDDLSLQLGKKAEEKFDIAEEGKYLDTHYNLS